MFAPGTEERDGFKIAVGVNACPVFHSTRGILIAANVGDPSIPNSHSVSVVDVEHRERIAELKVPGRTRWTIYDQTRELFFTISLPQRGSLLLMLVTPPKYRGSTTFRRRDRTDWLAIRPRGG